jgi:hypothetical protein
LFQLSLIIGRFWREIPKFWSDRQFSKHPTPISTTEFGIVRDDNDEHPSKHSPPRDLTEFGSVSDDNDEHS